MTEAEQPARGRSAIVDPDLVEAARILRGALVRVHPSFRFEERLAARLVTAAVAPAPRGAGAPDPRSDPIPFRGLDDLAGPVALEQLAIAASPALGSPGSRRRYAMTPHLARVPRGALIGGAIASGVSLAGAALIAQRWRNRPSRSPFARAARAAHRAVSERARAVPGGTA